MAETKSVIDIEIKDEKFRSFVSLFNKYKGSLDKMPGQWGKVNDSVGSVKGSMDGIQHAVDSIAKRLDKTYQPLQRINNEARRTTRTFKDIGTQVASISGSLASATLSLAKWGALSLGGGLLGAGAGLFGMRSLGEGFTSVRSQSMGLGISPGQLRALQNVYGKYHDIGSITSSMMGAQTTPEGQRGFMAAGVNPQQQNIAQMLPAVLKMAGEIGKTTPKYALQSALDAYGLSALGITPEIATREAGISEEERARRDKESEQAAKDLNQRDKSLQSWQRFVTQLDNAADKIKIVLGDGLVKLTGPLESLSKAFVDAVSAFLSNPKLQEWIGEFAKKIQEVGEWLRTANLTSKFNDFFDGIAKIGESLTDLSNGIDLVLENIPGTRQNKEKAEFDRQQELYQSQQKLAGLGGKMAAFKVDPALQESLVKSGLDKFVTSGVRTNAEQAALYHHQDPKTGKWYTKEGYPVAAPGLSKHQTGQAVDVKKSELAKWSDADLAKYDLYRPHKDDPVHIEQLSKRVQAGDKRAIELQNEARNQIKKSVENEATESQPKNKETENNRGYGKPSNQQAFLGVPTQSTIDVQLNQVTGINYAVNTRQLYPYLSPAIQTVNA